MMDVTEPAYARLQVDERRRQLLKAGSELFAEHAYDDISMRQIAEAAGVSKPLLYHYFPSKTDLFKAAVAEHAAELQALVESATGDNPAERLARTLDAYLAWIEQNALTWSKLIQSAATIPEARQLVTEFRAQTLSRIVEELTGSPQPPAALRNALDGWLAHIDAAILDWIEHRDLARDQVRDLLLAAFVAAIQAAQQIDPTIELELDAPAESGRVT
jgi:AcrR family transcriptional regulator